MTNTHKIYCKQVKLNSQGYDSQGDYFGQGKPVYCVEVKSLVSCPVDRPKGSTWVSISPADQLWLSLYSNWHTPYFNYVRAWDRIEAVSICRPAIGVSLYNIPDSILISKNYFIQFISNNQGE